MPDGELVCARESGDDRELPGGWRFARLRDVAIEMFGGGTPSTKNPKYWGGQIPWTTSAVIAESDTVLSGYQRSISEIALRESSTRIAPAGSLLIGTRVGVGKCVVTPFAVAINQDLTAVVVKADAAIADYIAFALKLDSIRRWIDGAKRGTTIKGIPRDDIGRLVLPLPPLEEQRAIARVLRTIQRAKEATEKVIAATRELKKSLLRHLFTYGPGPLASMSQVELQETPMGAAPAHWTIGRLGDPDVAEIRTGTSAFPTKYPTGAERLLFLKVSDLNDLANSRVVTRAASEARLTTDSLSKLSYVPTGSVVFPKRGAAIATNKKRLTGQPSLLDPNLIALCPGSNVVPKYLLAWLENFDLRSITDDATLPQINKKDLQA